MIVEEVVVGSVGGQLRHYLMPVPSWTEQDIIRATLDFRQWLSSDGYLLMFNTIETMRGSRSGTMRSAARKKTGLVNEHIERLVHDLRRALNMLNHGWAYSRHFPEGAPFIHVYVSALVESRGKDAAIAFDEFMQMGPAELYKNLYLDVLRFIDDPGLETGIDSAWSKLDEPCRLIWSKDDFGKLWYQERRDYWWRRLTAWIRKALPQLIGVRKSRQWRQDRRKEMERKWRESEQESFRRVHQQMLKTHEQVVREMNELDRQRTHHDLQMRDSQRMAEVNRRERDLQARLREHQEALYRHRQTLEEVQRSEMQRISRTSLEESHRSAERLASIAQANEGNRQQDEINRLMRETDALRMPHTHVYSGPATIE